MLQSGGSGIYKDIGAGSDRGQSSFKESQLISSLIVASLKFQ